MEIDRDGDLGINIDIKRDFDFVMFITSSVTELHMLDLIDIRYIDRD